MKARCTAYYPGCSLHGMARMYDVSTRLVSERAGAPLREIPQWTCCGATSAHAVDRRLSLLLNARNLCAAAEAGAAAVAVPCAACYANLRSAAAALRQDAAARTDAAALLGKEIAAPEVYHLLDFFVQPEILESIRSRCARRFRGFAVACYYGCLPVRPLRGSRAGEAENPLTMERLLSAAGVLCPDWSHKTECCGASFGASAPQLMAARTGEILRQALDSGAQAIAVACPLCHTNLEMELFRLGRRDVPVVFFTQLLGLAMGYTVKQLGLQQLLADAFAWEKALA